MRILGPIKSRVMRCKLSSINPIDTDDASCLCSWKTSLMFSVTHTTDINQYYSWENEKSDERLEKGIVLWCKSQ